MFVKSVKFVIASFLVAGSLSNAIADSANDEKMKKAALKAGCLACHSVEAGKGVAPAGTDKPVGPAWADVVLEGSNPYSSHWKDKVSGIAMPPNAVAITEADARQLVFWILSIK